MPRPLHIACLQTRPKPDFRAALDEALPLAEAAVAAGARMLFLPEYCGGLASDGARLVPPHATEEHHDFLNGMRDFAQRSSVWIQIGSIAITGEHGKLINRGFMLDDTGAIRGRYDKIHLFDIQLSADEVYRESETIAGGSKAVVHQTPFGKVGHTICYDLRFPQLYRDLAHSGAEILTAPAAFTKKTGEAHWHVLNRARAIENTAYMVSACAVGPIEGGGESYGHSLIVNPWGEVIADGGPLPGVVSARIDLDQVAQAAGRVPSLSHDRPFTRLETQPRSVA